MKRPDPAEMAENLFSKLDTSGQGYIEKADLQSAFDKVSSKTNIVFDVIRFGLTHRMQGYSTPACAIFGGLLFHVK